MGNTVENFTKKEGILMVSFHNNTFKDVQYGVFFDHVRARVCVLCVCVVCVCCVCVCVCVCVRVGYER